MIASFQASAVTVEVARGNWSNIPVVKNRSFQTIHSEAVDALHRAFGKGECVLPGQSKNRLDLKIPFLLEYSPGGKLQRLVLHKLGCDSVERILASVLLKQAQTGEFESAGTNLLGWYRGELQITSS
jgi:hypothetical protein